AGRPIADRLAPLIRGSMYGGRPSGADARACRRRPCAGGVVRLTGKAVAQMRVNLKLSEHAELAVARALLLGVVVTMLMSTSVSICFEFLSFIAFAACAAPRRRLIAALRSPIVIALLPFALVVFLGIFHGAASWANALSALSGWRRMLLLPL